MQPELVKLLLDLNREFYAAFARDFSDTRSSERLNLDPIAPYLANGLRLLDAGCGNGRLAERLDREGLALDYLGVDAAEKLIAVAERRKRTFRNVKAEFRTADLSEPGWGDSLRDRGPFDLILALAVLHHLPGFELRRRVLSDMRSFLAPGGHIILSNWQFYGSERLRGKIVPWGTIGVDERELEPGDALIDWKRGGEGVRYVHLLQEEEVSRLAGESALAVVDQFLADRDLNLFSVLDRAP
ncbi:MAG: class I SAM-dependent methyltransferase [Rudaea sp.]